MLSDMNGNVLHEFYLMCRANRDSMFESLKAEVPKGQSLSVSTYLRFLDEIKKFVPVTAQDKSLSTSMICSVM